MKRGWLLFGLGVASAVGYTLIARAAGAAGFPLDDSWIHQTYARNLGWHGQWAFILGQPSAGSTAPLWTFLLAAGYAARIDPLLWTMILNAVLLGGLTWLADRITGRWWVGALTALEWHLVWAAASGMETVLFCGLVMGAWWLADWPTEQQRLNLLCGALIGLSVWARPDGLTVLPFIALLIAWRGGGPRQQAQRLGGLVLGFGLLIVPYFIFNYALNGQLWPNTFFAKQAEYAILRELPLWQRVSRIFFTPLIGPLLLLAPGVILAARRRWVALLWVSAFLLSYALRLPVTYQHGRYLIPVAPMLIVIGSEGLAGWAQPGAALAARRVISRVWVLGLGAVAVAFWGVGANALITDVRIIESEMVATAKWVAANLPPGAVVAAHDIGALGYWAEVQLIDLAGLVSPEVIPELGDDDGLGRFVGRSGAEYVITYPGWCPEFTRQLTPVFHTGPLCDPAAPNLHMAVYQVNQRYR